MHPTHRPHVYVLTWSVPRELHRQMKVCAAAESVPLVEWCRRAFAEAVAARQPDPRGEPDEALTADHRPTIQV